MDKCTKVEHGVLHSSRRLEQIELDELGSRVRRQPEHDSKVVIPTSFYLWPWWPTTAARRTASPHAKNAIRVIQHQILSFLAHTVSLHLEISPLKELRPISMAPKIHSGSASEPLLPFVDSTPAEDRTTLDSRKFRPDLILSHLIQPWGRWALSTALYRPGWRSSSPAVGIVESASMDKLSGTLFSFPP